MSLEALSGGEASAEQARLDAPSEITQGAVFEVNWLGPGSPRDHVSLVETGDAGRRYENQAFTDEGNPLRFVAPDRPGPYELRYVDGYSGRVLARTTLAVVPAKAALTIPNHVDAGARFWVTWEGPDHAGDLVTIVPADHPPQKYLDHAFTAAGKPAELVAPDKAGVYEVRYLSGRQRYRVVTAVPILVGELEASLAAPAEAVAGSVLEIRWSGPDNPEDFVVIAGKGARPGDYEGVAYTRQGNPLRLVAPDAPGAYEVGYVTGRTFQVLASHALEVVPAEASVKAQEAVRAGEAFEVHWEGPDNPDDFVGILKAEDGNGLTSFTYTRRGNPLRIQAPGALGDYEIGYFTGQSRRRLASAPIRVNAAPSPGVVAVSMGTDGALAPGGPPTVQLIVDTSAGMLEDHRGSVRLGVAKRGIIESIEQVLPPGTLFGIRVLGNGRADPCHTGLHLPLRRLDRSESVARVRELEARPVGRAPIARSLELLAEDLRGVEGPAMVAVITSGEDDCGGNPHRAIEYLRASATDARINVIGVGVEEFARKQTLTELAHRGRGLYFAVAQAGDLVDAIREALGVAFELVDSRGDVVKTGVVGGNPVEVTPGTYTVKVLSDPPRLFDQVEVQPGKRVEITLAEKEPKG